MNNTVWTREGDESDVTLNTAEDNPRRLVRLHEKGHRAGVFICNARAYKAWADDIYIDSFGAKHAAKSDAPCFYACF